MNIINISQLSEMQKESYVLIDIRDEGSILYGVIPGAISIPAEELKQDTQKYLDSIDKQKKLIIYCQRGQISVEIAELLEGYGRESYSLEGGYNAYLVSQIEANNEENDKQEKAEKSIRKKFHKQIFSPFAKACQKYQLINEGDHIAVCISGGKDSMLMAKLFQELKRHGRNNFDVVFLVMNPGYNDLNYQMILENAKILEVPITVFETQIFETVVDIEDSPCYLCARMRRGYLYSKAQELGCNKIALGHHFDDVIETIVMGMMYGGQVQTMMPKLHSTNFPGMELIRPLYLVRERDIIHWCDYNNLKFIRCACKFTERTEAAKDNKEQISKRKEVKKLIATIEKDNPYVPMNIFRSVENVNLSTIIAYKSDGVKHHFLETYDDE